MYAKRANLPALFLTAVVVGLGGCAATSAPRELFPGVTLNDRDKVVCIDGTVCIERGILEYIAVTEGGKDYESILMLNCRPSQLHAALLMAGYQAGPLAPPLRGDYRTDSAASGDQRPEGAPRLPEPPAGHWAGTDEPTPVMLDLDVRQPDESWERYPIEHLLVDRRSGGAPERLTWGFTGSYFYSGSDAQTEEYMADIERSMVALWYDPSAMFNLMEDVGNPYRGETVGLEVNPDTLPARGTPVRLVITPRAD